MEKRIQIQEKVIIVIFLFITAINDDMNKTDKIKIEIISFLIINNLCLSRISCWNWLFEKSWNKYLKIDSARIKLEDINIILTIDLSLSFILVNRLSKPIDAKTEIENWKNRENRKKLTK